MQVKRITCPSCNTELEVRNSKAESVKHIACPVCQKELCVDFSADMKREDAFPPLFYGELALTMHEGINQIALPDCELIEIRVVQLKDGSSKCLVRALNEQQAVLLNGEPLEKDDEVSLSIGDVLQIRNTVLSYGQPGKAIKIEEKPIVEEPKHQQVAADPQPQYPIPQWGVACIALVIAVVAVWLLWPSKEESHVSPTVQTAVSDSTKKMAPQKTVKASKSESHVKDKDLKGKVVDTKETTTSEYSLEQQALNGNMEAQYELGNKLVRRSGSNNVIRGIKYLRLAADNGSSKARNTLIRIVNTLQQQADNGDSIAYQILLTIE